MASIHFSLELTTFIGYFAVLLGIAWFSYQKQTSDADFLMGNRSLNFWLTALSAHASDMSSWLFLGYPALIYSTGVFSAWAAIGLTLFMFLNWHFIAPKLRTITEQSNSLTLSSYFETRFGDTSGTLRLLAGWMSILFFLFYISSGLVGLGILVETLFNLSYLTGVSIGLCVVVIYVFMGGYKTIAWIDFFQGIFLLGVIICIPLILLKDIGGLSPVLDVISKKGLSTSLIPNFAPSTLLQILFSTAGWGLGYFGQPHIITKFMGIRRVSDMYKAKYVGISWQAIALSCATLIGLIGIYLFPTPLAEPEQLTLQVVKDTLPPFFAGLVLCAILAATTNVMAAQILVVASNIASDVYKKFVKRATSPQEILWVSRFSVLLISLLAFLIAFFKISTIYQLVLFSWSGLGSAFGPLIIFSLYVPNVTKQGAIGGILVGGLTALIWPYFESLDHWGIPSLIPGYCFSSIAIVIISKMTRETVES